GAEARRRRRRRRAGRRVPKPPEEAAAGPPPLSVRAARAERHSAAPPSPAERAGRQLPPATARARFRADLAEMSRRAFAHSSAIRLSRLGASSPPPKPVVETPLSRGMSKDR